MAGLYDDAPGHRMAYDADGSGGTLVNFNTSGVTQFTLAQLQAMNDEDSDSVTLSSAQGESKASCIIFPELRDVVGYCYIGGTTGSGSSIGNMEWSADTTNGLDGTWTSVGTWNRATSTNLEYLRNDITSLSITGAKGVRFRFATGGSGGQSFTILNLHLYGHPTASGDRLRLWHPTLDQEITGAYFDFGNVYQGQTITPVQFRVKNTSATLTASTITVSREVPTDGGTQTTLDALQLSDDNVTYGNTTSIASLAPGAISAIRYLKYAPNSSASLGLRWARIKASAATWT